MIGKLMTVLGTVLYDTYIGVEDGPLLECNNLKGWLQTGSRGYFTVKEVDNHVYHVINFFKVI